ncbi:MAG: hypothetical protein JWM74_1153 [Myxococcaceae bacterium]|nr:hypothetical protein [Myxococcaceae bacterium]
MTLSDEELKAIHQRSEHASRGPWRVVLEGRDQWGGASFIMTGPDDDRGEDLNVVGASEADLEFIARERKDIPRMLSEIERLRGRAEQPGPTGKSGE